MFDYVKPAIKPVAMCLVLGLSIFLTDYSTAGAHLMPSLVDGAKAAVGLALVMLGGSGITSNVNKVTASKQAAADPHGNTPAQ